MGGVVAAKVGEDAEGELDVRTALLLDATRDVVVKREDVATSGVVATSWDVATTVVGFVASRVLGTEGARAVFPEVRFALHSARELPLMQQPKVAQ